jgi:hypothetical protein
MASIFFIGRLLDCSFRGIHGSARSTMHDSCQLEEFAKMAENREFFVQDELAIGYMVLKK